MAVTVLWQNDCQVPATLGTTVSAANTGTGTNFGGGANNALSSVSVGSGNTFVEDNAHVPAGISQCWKMTHGGTAQCNAFVTWSGAQSDITAQGELYYSGAPSGSSWTFGRLFSDPAYTTSVFSAAITTTNKVQIVETSGISVSSTATLTPGTWYYWVFRYQQSTNTLSLTFYPVGSGIATASATGNPTQSASYTINSARFGISNSTAIGVGPVWWAALQVGGGGQLARQDYTAPAPHADAGLPQTAEPGYPCVLDSSSSWAAPGASLTGWAWAQTAGPAVTPSGTASQQASFTPPPASSSQTYTFQVTVTDSNGQTSSASVTVTVPAATAYSLDAGGTWQPQASPTQL